jgi:hypothetical protein
MVASKSYTLRLQNGHLTRVSTVGVVLLTNAVGMEGLVPKLRASCLREVSSPR